MPAVLPSDRYLEVLAGAAAALAFHAAEARLDAAVPTCPRWRVADLVAHQGMVHRWAAGQLRLDDTAVPGKTQILREVPAGELLDWFRAGAGELLATLAEVPPDVAAMVFLNDAPAPRLFWARRQTHETTIHAVDALAAKLARMPRAEEVDVEADVALDGIDELLTGFFTRGRSKIADEEPFTVAVAPTDADCAWTMRVADGRLTTERHFGSDADVTFAGTAAQLYLGLWNRGDEMTATGRSDVLDRWRARQRVYWS